VITVIAMVMAAPAHRPRSIGGTDSENTTRTQFVVYLEAITLQPTEVHNRAQRPIALPADVIQRFQRGMSSMVIKGFTMDIVSSNDPTATDVSVPLYHLYNHHFLLYMGDRSSMDFMYKRGNPLQRPCHGNCSDCEGAQFLEEPDDMRARRCLRGGMGSVAKCLDGLNIAQQNKATDPTIAAIRSPLTVDDGNNTYKYVSFGGASGAEFRNNPHVYPGDYGAVVPHPEAMVAVYHFINTKGTTSHDHHSGIPAHYSDAASPYLECPCTSRRIRNPANGSIDGCDPSPAFHCNEAMLAKENTGCSVATYTGGFRCCKNGLFLAEDPKAAAPAGPITVWAKYTFTYEASTERTRSLTPSSCCDVSGATDDNGGGRQHRVRHPGVHVGDACRRVRP